ncbi:MAG: hypothetical protein K8Q97_00275 [Candidatus Andersenbacteria bacterium]|nr:hypothetical protein [Candidatus Andersenbacteria bacterium]
MRNIKKQAKLAIFAIIGLSACALFSMRAQEHQLPPRTPDSIHKHQVFASYPLTEQFTALSRGLSAVGVYAESSNPEATAHVALRDIANDRIVLQRDVPVKSLGHVPIPRQAMSAGQRYSITISAEELTKTHAIKIAYQSDATLDPTSVVTQAGVIKQGSLGLIEYERPTIALQLTRWLLLPHQRGLWLGVMICAAAIFLIRKNSFKAPASREVIVTRDRKKYAYFAIIIIASLVIYWPATHLFFYSDDVPILVRVAQLWQHNPLLLLTPHRYTDSDPASQFGFDFYRPISFSLYPLALHLIFPPNASLYYFLNISLFSGIACCLFAIASRITASRPASLLAVALWMSHSSKLGLLYWWSSVQDLLASLFAMLSVVLYFKWKDSRNTKIVYASIASFGIALFSKEYVIVLPIALAGIELVSGSSRTKVKQIVTNILPYILMAGIFLVINTAVLGDPTLPEHKHTDKTYALSANPINIIRNIVVYTSFTAEQRLWPQYASTNNLESFLSNKLELWRLKTAGPYYPGVVIIGIAIASIIIYWKNKQTRNILLLSYTWWIVFIGPFLLFTSDWRSRWLTLSIFGISLVIVTILQRIIPKKLPISWYALCIIVCMYGFITARNPELTRFFREQSAYTQYAYQQLLHEEINTPQEKRIILIGIVPDQETSLNAYLFRLYAKNPNADIIYAATMPEKKEQGDVIINMTGIVPYYPESEK